MLLAGLVLLLLGLGAGYAAWSVHRGLRVGTAFLHRLGPCETVAADDRAVDRLVAVRGILVSAQGVPDPLDGTPCGWCRVTVEARRRHRRGDRWDTVDDQLLEAPFALHDPGGGVVTVSSVGDRVEAAEVRGWTLRADALPQEVQRYLALRNISQTGLLLTKWMRVTVSRLPAGHPCTVVGVPSHTGELPGFRASAAARLRIATPEAVTPLTLPALRDKLRSDHRAIETLRAVTLVTSAVCLVASLGALFSAL